MFLKMIPFWVVVIIIGVVVIVGLIVILQTYKNEKPSPIPQDKDIITIEHLVPENPSLYIRKDKKKNYKFKSVKSFPSRITVSGIGTVNWGDGTIDSFNGTDVILTHNYNPGIYILIVEGTVTKLITGGSSQGGGGYIDIVSKSIELNAPNLESFGAKFDFINPVEPIIGLENSKNIKMINISNSVGFSIAPNLELDSLILNSDTIENPTVSITNIQSCNIKKIILFDQIPLELYDSNTQEFDLLAITQLENLIIRISNDTLFSTLKLASSPLTSIDINGNSTFDDITIDGEDFLTNAPISLTSIKFTGTTYTNGKELNFSRFINLESLDLSILQNTNSITLPSTSLNLDLGIGENTMNLINLNTETVKYLRLYGDFYNITTLDLINAQRLNNLIIDSNPSLESINLNTNYPLNFTGNYLNIDNNQNLNNITLEGTLDLTGLFQVSISNNPSLVVNDGSSNTESINYIGSSLALQNPQPTSDDFATVTIAGNSGDLDISVPPWSVLSSENWTVSNSFDEN